MHRESHREILAWFAVDDICGWREEMEEGCSMGAVAAEKRRNIQR
jgi:hypothetical protein